VARNHGLPGRAPTHRDRLPTLASKRPVGEAPDRPLNVYPVVAEATQRGVQVTEYPIAVFCLTQGTCIARLERNTIASLKLEMTW
jgi:hypothetical protein